MNGRNYRVAPRYTPGSPALVDRATAERVAREERAAYDRILSGRYGAHAETIADAKARGLGGIVEEQHVKAWSIVFVDLLTGARGERKAGGKPKAGRR